MLAACVLALQIMRERRASPSAGFEQMLYVRSPAVAQRLALSFKAIAADVYWIRLVQYYGSIRLSKDVQRHYDLLYPLLDLTTSLDPHFTVAYRFGAFFLSEAPPGGPGRPDLARALLEKAMATNPTRWEYPYDIGFVYYRDADYQHAAEWFRRARTIEGSPSWLEPLAAVTLTAGGQTTASRALWQQMLASSEEEWLRGVAEFRLKQLDTIEFAKSVERAVDAYVRAHGTPPIDWSAMIREGYLRSRPLDSAAYPLVLQPDGTVTVSRQSPMWPLPTEKAP
jgi:tetratricopeptide (TPR) repeat protein